MIIQALAFYLFAAVAVVAGVMVISARNPVHSVLFLILAFFNAAGLFVLLGAEFLAMILVVVYVGAVAVMFLFVVMMLDINFVELRQGFLRYLPIGGLIGLVLLAELLIIVGGWTLAPEAIAAAAAPTPPVDEVTNTHALGQLIYTRYLYLFQAAGLVLLVAMIGAIVLTLRTRPGVRRQSVPDQLAREARTSVELRKVPTGKGHLMLEIGLPHFLSVAAILFATGIFGIFLNRKNIIVILMSVELILLAVNINLVAFAFELGDLVGQVFALFVLTVAAAEAAIGLAILVIYFRNRGTIAVEDINLMKG